MTALERPTDSFGYGPAMAARLESNRAMRRALPASFALVTGILLALAIAQRLVPAPTAMPEAGPVNEHWMIPPGVVPPAAGEAVFRTAPTTPSTRGVPVPVPDASAPADEPNAAGVPRDGATPGQPAGVSPGEGAGDVAPGPDPQPGEFIYADQLPERVVFVAPEYSDLARDAGVGGTVLLWALVDLDGSVKAVQVIRSVPLLDAAASTAVRRWRFTPALAGGHPLRVWVAVPVRFSLH